MSNTDTHVRERWSSKPESFEELRRRAERSRQCRALPALEPGEAERLVAAFVAKRGSPTKCPAVYLVPIQQ